MKSVRVYSFDHGKYIIKIIFSKQKQKQGFNKAKIPVENEHGVNNRVDLLLYLDSV